MDIRTALNLIEDAQRQPEAAAQEIAWAVPKACRYALEQGDSTVVWLDPAKMDPDFARDRDFYIGPGGQGGIRTRYPDFGQWLAAATVPVFMPEICIGWRGVAFTNGRHRYAWMRDHGARAVPFVVPAGEAETLTRQFGASEQRTLIH